MLGKILGGLGFLVGVTVLCLFAMPTYRQGEPSIAGKMAPDFALQMDGKSIHLSDLRGKVVVLDFWASWCPPCVEETPALIALHRDISTRGGIVLGVSLDDDPAAYEKFLKDQGVNFPTYLDASKAIPTKYGTSLYPEAYVIGRDGRIVRKVVGPQNWVGAEMKEIFDRLLPAATS
jgi:cytochrome c biogenesis protein CcmG, thiol:disulfide interchange protein DsbE